MTKEKDTKKDILKAYKNIVKSEKRLPTYKDFLFHDISKDKIRNHYGGIQELHLVFKEENTDFLAKHFSSVEDIFSSRKSVSNSEKKKYVITTAVADSKADKNFLKALDNYAEKNDAQIVIMPCESVTNSFEKKTAIFDPVFNDEKYLFVQEDSELNENITLCSIQVSAKQIKPITGLQRIGNREGSYVFASPKQFLEYVPSGNSRTKNFAIMTPGACTLPSYYTDTFVSKRLSYIANFDHTMGAIIVEVLDDQYFDFRQIQSDPDGSFIDMGIQYSPSGSTKEVPSNIILGDLHGVKVDRDALDYFLDVFNSLKVKSVFAHDIFDGYSISHHIRDIYEKSVRASDGEQSLEIELQDTYDLLDKILNFMQPETLYVVKSNHDEFLTRYLTAGRYVEDPENHYLALKIATALFEDKDVLQHAFETVRDGELDKRIKFLDREDSVKIGGVECAAHGDLGLNGARASINSIEKVYGNAVVGHTHAGAIQRGVFRVGTLSKLNLGYNKGPSSWTHTCCILYENGQRQLINYVKP